MFLPRSLRLAPVPALILPLSRAVGTRSDDGTSELIPVAAGNATRLIKWITGKIGIGALKIERRSVNLVGSRFGLRRHDGADGFAKFRVVVLVNNLCFVDRIEIGIDNDNAQDWILVVSSVEFERRAGEVLPICFDLLRALRVFASGVTPVKTLRSWRE